MRPILHQRGLDGLSGTLADFREPIEIWVDAKLRKLTRRGWYRAARRLSPARRRVRVLLLIEPDEIGGLRGEVLADAYRHFDHVLTHDDVLLERLPNAAFFPYGTSWVERETIARDKRFELSFVIGAKEQAEGHRLRRRFWDARERIVIPRRFFFSRYGGPPGETCDLALGASKAPLFESQFHLCIENCRSERFFTEKIMDCLRAGCIPVYWGARRIGDFFDVAGIIAFETLDEGMERINALTPETFGRMAPAAARNYERAAPYVHYFDALSRKLAELGYTPCAPDAGPSEGRE